MTQDPQHPANETAGARARRVPAWIWRAAFIAVTVSLATWAGYLNRPKPPGPQPAAVAPRAEAAPQPARPARQRLPHFAAVFGDEHPSADVRLVANWVADSGDADGRAFVVIDKKQARVWVFGPLGDLISQAPALLGAAVGDDPVPGIGEKPLSQVKPEEKTTPAGRFVAEPGVNANGEDIVWVSYDLAVSMHRVRPLVKAERRLERLASPTPDDNRISFGCINLPTAFYEQVLAPTVKRHGAVVYILPETRTPQQQFGLYDVDAQAATAPLAHARLATALAPVSHGDGNVK
ncbi:hypothetical protein [Ramlibacter humi]|uniref:hypothetical protein n=1 Tax=Ramlibacter humi TaxID=2530451 RepID=UPI00197DA2CA|nr:hypothetical protein [Ramlibacter humi]